MPEPTGSRTAAPGSPLPTPAGVQSAPATPVFHPPAPIRPARPVELPGVAAPPRRPPPAPAAPEPPFDWEKLIGVKLFSWIAGAALALAGVFWAVLGAAVLVLLAMVAKLIRHPPADDAARER